VVLLELAGGDRIASRLADVAASRAGFKFSFDGRLLYTRPLGGDIMALGFNSVVFGGST
jgi:hypothetical protein